MLYQKHRVVALGLRPFPVAPFQGARRRRWCCLHAVYFGGCGTTRGCVFFTPALFAATLLQDALEPLSGQQLTPEPDAERCDGQGEVLGAQERLGVSYGASSVA